MSDDENLFRREALDAHVGSALGPAFVASATPLGWLAYLWFGLALLAVGYACWGSYTRRVTVGGFVHPAGDVLRIYAPFPGVVVGRHVEEGQRVDQGARLFTVSGERQSALGPTRARMVDALRQQLDSYRQSIDEARRLSRLGALDLSRRLTLIERELDDARRESATLRQRLAHARAARQRFAALAASGFVSAQQLEARDEARLEAERNLAASSRAQAALERERGQLAAELTSLPLRQQSRETELTRLADGLRQALAQTEAERETRLTAPRAGVVSALAAEPGSHASPQQPLALLVPSATEMEVHLFAPSRAIGFIRPGARVKLRLEAFPYQKFGHVDGRVHAVARTALLPGELPAVSAPAEPLYRIRVRLARPTIRAYGRETPLLPSMRVEGDLLLETRRLYEWALEPLYSVSGKW